MEPTVDELEWDAPGPGDWWLVREHFPYAVSGLFAALFPPVTAGWKDGGARFGLPIGMAQWASVNGWIYYGPQVPLTDAEMAERAAVAPGVLRAAPWRDEVRRWHDEERPVVVRNNRVLQGVDVSELDDAALVAHVEAVVTNFFQSAPLHFAHVGFDLAAGRLCVALRQWGLDPGALPRLLTGGSPASAAVDRHLAAIAAELDAAGAAPRLRSLDQITAASAAAQQQLDAYLEDYGCRPVCGHDILEPTFGERPDLVLASLNARRSRGAALAPSPIDVAASAAIAQARAAVPAEDQGRFDELVEDARSSYALRDDDVGVCWNWPLGLIRRALLELARRLHEQGMLREPLDLFEADLDEVRALMALASESTMTPTPSAVAPASPSAAELARRRERWRAAQAADPPGHLSGTGDVPTEPEVPASVAELTAIRDAVWSLMPPRVDAPLHGIGVGTGPAVGRARVVLVPEELFDLEEGDVLVTIATTTAFNAVFPMLAAVVTEQGSLFSHAAILAREVGLPAVVGVPDLFVGIDDGDLIEVDPGTGSVRVLEHAAARS